MEDNKDKPLAIVITTHNKRKCKCCGRELPIEQFRPYGKKGYRKVCISCERKEQGVNPKLKEFTSRELREELQARGYHGVLKYIKVEEFKL